MRIGRHEQKRRTRKREQIVSVKSCWKDVHEPRYSTATGFGVWMGSE